MSFTEKIDVLELLIDILKEHDNQLESLIEKMEIIDQTISKDPRLCNSVKQYDSKNLEDVNTRSILIVDDDESLANSFKLILQSVGYNVDVAYLGYQALNMINQKKYDLIILDINLPDIMGYEVATEIDDLHEGTNIIYITGYSSLNNENEKETLIKPIEPEQLLETATKNLTSTLEKHT